MSAQPLSMPKVAEPSPNGSPSRTAPVRRVAPGPRAAVRRTVVAVLEVVLGDKLAQRPRHGLGVLALIVALLAVIALTLSVGNAVLALVTMAGMRVACEWRQP